MFRSKLNRRAFTLIELLVVIAIIGILATVSIISLSNARAKSRDAKRAGDMKQIQTALELFFNDNNRYPNFSEWATGQIYSTSTAGTSTYMQVIPTAPTPNDGSCSTNQNSISYSPTYDGSSYSISFCLGGNTGILASGPKCLTPGGILDQACFVCGNQVTVAPIAGHTCNEGAPDYDTCTYDTVQIGTQCWMKQNMNIGSIVNAITTQSNNGILEKYCYDPDGGLSDYTYCQSDGGLYQQQEAIQYPPVEGAQGICPAGWHVPTDAQQNTLDQYLTDPPNTCNPDRNDYDCADAGSKLKASSPIWNGTNISGFSALPAGIRLPGGEFAYRGAQGDLWSSSPHSPYFILRALSSNYSTIYRLWSSDSYYGFSVRCLQD